MAQQAPAFEELPSELHDFADEGGPNPFVEEDELLEEDLEAEDEELG